MAIERPGWLRILLWTPGRCMMATVMVYDCHPHAAAPVDVCSERPNWLVDVELNRMRVFAIEAQTNTIDSTSVDCINSLCLNPL